MGYRYMIDAKNYDDKHFSHFKGTNSLIIAVIMFIKLSFKYDAVDIIHRR